MIKVRTANLIKKLHWENDFFKIQCGELLDFDEPISEQETNKFDWIQGKVTIGDQKGVFFYENEGFQFEDLRIGLFKIKSSHDVQAQDVSIRLAKLKDASYITSIAEEVLVENSRYLSVVGVEKTKFFYQKWVENAIVGIYDDFCYIIEIQNKIVGFITLRKSKSRLEIGLLAIDKQFHSKGLGKALIHFSEGLLDRLECSSIHVVAAGKNIKAIQFYIGLGFNIEIIESWYYRFKEHNPPA